MATMSAIFGVLATALAVVGLYGVDRRYTVARRTQKNDEPAGIAGFEVGEEHLTPDLAPDIRVLGVADDTDDLDWCFRSGIAARSRCAGQRRCWKYFFASAPSTMATRN